jgi:hypothetical protein
MLSYGLFTGVCSLNAIRNTLSVPSSEARRYEDGTDSVFQKLEFKLQMPVNNPEESIQHPERGKILKSRINIISLQRCQQVF